LEPFLQYGPKCNLDAIASRKLSYCLGQQVHSLGGEPQASACAIAPQILAGTDYIAQQKCGSLLDWYAMRLSALAAHHGMRSAKRLSSRHCSGRARDAVDES